MTNITRYRRSQFFKFYKTPEKNKHLKLKSSTEISIQPIPEADLATFYRTETRVLINCQRNVKSQGRYHDNRSNSIFALRIPRANP